VAFEPLLTGGILQGAPALANMAKLCRAFFLLSTLSQIYDAAAKSVNLDLKINTFPPVLTVPLTGWPGIKSAKFEVSGLHPYVVAAAFPWELNSETARDKEIKLTDQSAWVPSVSEDQVNQNYMHYRDFLIFPHQTVEAAFVHNPSYDSFAIGLSRDSSVWSHFPDGATLCTHTHTLYLEPHRMTSCLGEHIATLPCDATGPLKCKLDTDAPLRVNGVLVNPQHVSVALAPFDNRILMGLGSKTEKLCEAFVADYFYSNSSLSLGPFSSGRTLRLSGKNIVPPLSTDARIPRNVLYCDREYLSDNEIVVGALQSGYSFYYSPRTNTLELYTTRPNTMKNTWEDVIILNLCILCLVHFFADGKKDITKPSTLYPEAFGILAASTGLALQNCDSGVFERVKDIDGGRTAAYALAGSVVVQLCVHASCIGLLFAKRKNSQDSGLDPKLEVKCQTLRRLTAECSLLGSIFLQVLSGSRTMFDSYVGFVTGLVLVYNGTYRACETIVGSVAQYTKERNLIKNHLMVRLIALVAVAVSAWTFYVIGACPSVDPVSGLSNHIVEVGSLVLTVTFTLGGAGLAHQY